MIMKQERTQDAKEGGREVGRDPAGYPGPARRPVHRGVRPVEVGADAGAALERGEVVADVGVDEAGDPVDGLEGVAPRGAVEVAHLERLLLGGDDEVGAGGGDGGGARAPRDVLPREVVHGDDADHGCCGR